MEPDWIRGLIGGLMIGTGAAVFLLGSGRIMGASGLIGGLVDGSGRSDAVERAVFLAALMAVPAMLVWSGWSPRSDTHLTGNWAVIIVAGLCVGLGTRVANGCTSGHGVCGISRLSPRGIVATLIYIAAGVATVAVTRLVFGGLF